METHGISMILGEIKLKILTPAKQKQTALSRCNKINVHLCKIQEFNGLLVLLANFNTMLFTVDI